MEDNKNITAEEVMVQETGDESYKSGSVQYIDSREVAKMVGKEHKLLMRDIRRYIGQLGECNLAPTDFFAESNYFSEQNKQLPCYMITEKGCEFIAHKLTGQKGTKFTATYINRFHEMKDELVGRTGNGISAEVGEKLLEFMQQQLEFNKTVMHHIGVGKPKGNRMPQAEDSPFRFSKTNTLERIKKLDKMVTKIAELRDMNKNRVLHMMYVTLGEKADISLDAYRSVYQSETGDDSVSPLHVISQVDWIYKIAVDICEDTIERYEIFPK